MNVGDVVQFIDLSTNTRKLGTILQEDVWQARLAGQGVAGIGDHGRAEKLVCVMWCNGHVGWILRSRVSEMSDRQEGNSIPKDQSERGARSS